MKKKLLSLVLLPAVLAAGLVGCGNGGGGSAPAVSSGGEVVLNEVAHSIFYAAVYGAIEEGDFAGEGLEL